IHLITEQLLKNMPYRHELPRAKYHGFIGPSGVGKTQSMIKIILHYLKSKSINQFSCIFVNHHNLRVLEESKLCARIFNVPCYYVETQEDLTTTLEKTAGNDFVFIDFPAFDHITPENNYYIPFIEMYKNDFYNTLVYATTTKNFKQYCVLHENIIHELYYKYVRISPF
ncbi:MAG TPA: hypothetical protein PLD88_00040, partial [Candidatus Berkiella sp.]|nr:hypothetical protein [Candidatus Berkiella sp.]